MLFGCSNATPPHGLARTITVLEATDSSGTPMNFLTIQGQDATLEICKQLMGTLPPSPMKYSCRSGTVGEISNSSAKSPLPNGEKGVVAMLHITEASGRRNDVDASALLNVSGVLPVGRTMVLCQYVADAAGNRGRRPTTAIMWHIAMFTTPAKWTTTHRECLGRRVRTCRSMRMRHIKYHPLTRL